MLFIICFVVISILVETVLILYKVRDEAISSQLKADMLAKDKEEKATLLFYLKDNNSLDS
jgi:hypothetical protein